MDSFGIACQTVKPVILVLHSAATRPHFKSPAEERRFSMPDDTTSSFTVPCEYGMNDREVTGAMQPIPFDPANDLAPIPLDNDTCELAQRLKKTGLPWRPHVGCFVWDHHHVIKPDSPFPNHVYFILSLPRFIEIFGTLEALQEKLVWLPTWYQTQLLCQRYGIDPTTAPRSTAPKEELKSCYHLLIEALEKR